MFKLKIKNIIGLLLYAIPNTILSFGIVYIMNNVISGKEGFLNDYIGIVFVSIVIYTYLLNIIFQKKINKYSFELLCENEKKIFYYLFLPFGKRLIVLYPHRTTTLKRIQISPFQRLQQRRGQHRCRISRRFSVGQWQYYRNVQLSD